MKKALLILLISLGLLLSSCSSSDKKKPSDCDGNGVCHIGDKNLNSWVFNR